MAASHPLPQSIIDLSREVAQAEERSIMYRTCAWTVFEIDLDVGRRAREERRRTARHAFVGKESLGLGIRLETFYKGELS